MLVPAASPLCGTAFVGIPRATINFAITAGLVGLHSSVALPTLDGGRASRLAAFTTLAGLAYFANDIVGTSADPRKKVRGQLNHTAADHPTCARDFLMLGISDVTEAFLCGSRSLDALDSGEDRITGPACRKRLETLPLERSRYFNEAMSTCASRDGPGTDIVLASSGQGFSASFSSSQGGRNDVGCSTLGDILGNGSGGDIPPSNDPSSEPAYTFENIFDRLAAFFVANGEFPPPSPPPSSDTETADDDDKDQQDHPLEWKSIVVALAILALVKYASDRRNVASTPPVANLESVPSERASSVGAKEQQSSESTPPTSSVNEFNATPKCTCDACDDFYLLPGLLGSAVALARRAECGILDFSPYPPLVIPMNDEFGNATVFYDVLLPPVEFRPLCEGDPVPMELSDSSRLELINYLHYGDDIPLYFSPGAQQAYKQAAETPRTAQEATPPVLEHLNPLRWTLAYTKEYYVWVIRVLFFGLLSLLLECASYFNYVRWMLTESVIEAPAAAVILFVPAETTRNTRVDEGPPSETTQEVILPEPNAGAFDDVAPEVDDGSDSEDDVEFSDAVEVLEGDASDHDTAGDTVAPVVEVVAELSANDNVTKDVESDIFINDDTIVRAVEPIQAPATPQVLEDAASSDALVIDAEVVASEPETEVVGKGEGEKEGHPRRPEGRRRRKHKHKSKSKNKNKK